jgi:DNA-directed RNA polymerase I subunit RPA1
MITEGVNIQGMWSFSDFLDIHGIQSNDVASIRKAYGVEAARATVMREISSVFAVYGIEVDTRHLSLIADYMTFEGGYRPFNRMGIANNASPFAKMTFETSFKFLVDAALKGETDRLRNPSARLVVGKVVEGGTGSFEILQPLQ